MLFSQGYSESTDDTGENVKQFRCSIELERLMDQWIEAVIDSLTDHFSSGDKFSVKSVQNVLEVLSFTGLLWVEEFEELLDERGSDMNFQGLDVSAIVDDQLQEEFVDWLQVWPGWVDQ